MIVPASIFFDFNLPNATTWFYFSLLLALALFFKFSRLLSIRNWDVLSLFLPVPGLLLLLEGRNGPWDSLRQIGYVWLVGASGYLLLRCMVDLILVRRPALNPNLNLSGLAWLAGALFFSLVAVAVRQPNEEMENGSKPPSPIDQVQRQGERLVNKQARDRELPGVDARIWVERTLAIACHLAIVVGLIVIGWRHFLDVHAGMAAATFYLLLPYTFLLLPNTALEARTVASLSATALVVWAIVFYRLPWLAGIFLGLATGTSYFPAFLIPAWYSFYRGKGSGRFLGFLASTAGLSLVVIGAALLWEGALVQNLRSAMDLSDWQAWKEPETEGLWNGIHWAYRLPVFIGFLAFWTVTLFWPATKNLGHVLALSAAVLIGVQFWYADRGGVYILWYLPLVLLLVFRPNLTDRVPPVISPEHDRLARIGQWVKRTAFKRLKSPEPLARVS